MRTLVFAALFGLVGFVLPSPALAQTKAEIEIVLKDSTSLEEKGRQQLERLLSTYDLDPWIFTPKVMIESYVIPHSHPVLTLNTKYVRNDLRQLSTFVHEQAHWFEAADERDAASKGAIQALRRMYPHPPSADEIGTRSEHSTYLHLVINWLELDGMVELVGEKEARAILAGKSHYEWIYERVLEDTDKIGAVLAEHGMLITPEKGLVVHSDG